MSRSPSLHERFFCAPGRTLIVALHPFCAKEWLICLKQKTDYRLRKTDAPLRLGIRPSPTDVGRAGAPKVLYRTPDCFDRFYPTAVSFFCLAALRCMYIHIIQRASIVRLGKFHFFKIITLYNRRKAHSNE